jgi:GT2 family glycosyltransferase
MVKVVYTIIVTFNGMQWIDKCLPSLLNSDHATTVIVVDNGSTDETYAHIESHYPGVRLLKAGMNLGFGQGNNIGLKIALQEKADYIFLLNQDAWVERNTISDLLESHNAHPEYGILSPVHLNGRGNDFDDHFQYYLVRSDIRELLWKCMDRSVADNVIINTPFVNAAAWFISFQCLRKTGGFDPIFFHYGEDDNYGQRVLFHGFRIGILTSARICHDKERPVSRKQDIKKMVRKDWTQFLAYACDINAQNYRKLMLKSCARHIIRLSAAIVTLDRNKITYHFLMTRSIMSSFSSIKNSRKMSATAITPYL